MRPDTGLKDTALERIIRARTHLVMDEPFFGLLALRLKLIEDPSCDTMWTDSVSLGYNRDFVDSLIDVELRGVIGHEVLHIAAGHPWRQDHREFERWNEGGDYAINPLVIAAGMRLPENALLDEAYSGLSAEAIYDLLPPKPEADSRSSVTSVTGGESTEGEKGGAEDEPGEGASGPSKSKKRAPGEVRPAPADAGHEADWKMAMEAAVRMQGDLPLGIQRLVAETLKAKVDWREVLRHFFQTSIYSPDYAWQRPSARYLSLGLYLPSLIGSNVACIVLVRDSSASIGLEYHKLFNGEFHDIVETIRPEALYVLDVDAAVHQVQTVLPADEESFVSEMKGGGGTDFRPAFKWVEEQGVDCTCMIYLTDLLGKFPEVPPHYPVLWAVPEGSNRGAQPPFGDLVELTLP